MKNLTIFAMVLFLSFRVNAQDTSSVKWGIGISSAFLSSNTSGYDGDLNTTLTVPVYISDHFKIEPFLGYSRLTFDKVSEIPDYRIVENIKQNNYLFGSGLFYVLGAGESKLHFGAAIGYLISKQKTPVSSNYPDSKVDMEGNGYVISPVIGGEYLLSDYFSFGAEAHVDFVSIDYDRNRYLFDQPADPYVTEKISFSSIDVRAVLIFRFYL
jgi:hypothetical protein